MYAFDLNLFILLVAPNVHIDDNKWVLIMLNTFLALCIFLIQSLSKDSKICVKYI